MSTATKKPDTKSTSAAAKAKLAAGAAEIKKLTAAKKPATKSPVKDGGKLEVIPAPIIAAKGDVAEIMRKRLTVQGDAMLITAIDPETTKGEVLAMFDNFVGEGECWQIRLGQFIKLSAELPCFGGQSKFAAAMAASGRSLDSCKKYLSLVTNTPPELLTKGVGYTALAQTVKVRDPEKKAALIEKIVEAKEKGEPMTVEQVKKQADKLAPAKPKPKAPARQKLVLSDDDKHILAEFIDKHLRPTVLALEAANELSYLYDAEPEDVAELRGLLKALVRLDDKLEG